MKNTILILFLLIGIGSAVTTTEVKIVDTEAGSLPVMRKTNIDVVIDTSEFDTSLVILTTTGAPFLAWSDTVGQVFMRCDDSSGTDSVGGRLIWYGNPRADGKAIWEAIDSVSIAVASGVETQTSKAVVNAKRFQALRFILRNQLVAAAGKKTVCRDILLNRHKRLRY